MPLPRVKVEEKYLTHLSVRERWMMTVAMRRRKRKESPDE